MKKCDYGRIIDTGSSEKGRKRADETDKCYEKDERRECG